MALLKSTSPPDRNVGQGHWCFSFQAKCTITRNQWLFKTKRRTSKTTMLHWSRWWSKSKTIFDSWCQGHQSHNFSRHMNSFRWHVETVKCLMHYAEFISLRLNSFKIILTRWYIISSTFCLKITLEEKTLRCYNIPAIASEIAPVFLVEAHSFKADLDVYPRNSNQMKKLKHWTALPIQWFIQRSLGMWN